MADKKQMLIDMLNAKPTASDIFARNKFETEVNAPENFVTGSLLPFKRNKLTKEASWAVPEVVNSLARALTAPSRAYKGEFDPMSAQGVEEALNVGLNTMGAGWSAPYLTKNAAFSKAGSSTLPMFIGEKSPAWNKENAKLAAALENSGLTAEEIWKKTGTGRAVDQKWRQEISDDLAKSIPVENGKYTSLNEVMSHDDLFNAYPNLKNVSVKKSDKTYYDPNLNEIGSSLYTQDKTLNPFYQNQENKIYSVANKLDERGLLTSEKDLRLNNLLDKVQQNAASKVDGNIDTIKYELNPLIHEPQHIIQAEEGFARGGSPSEFMQQQDAIDARDILNLRREIANLENKGKISTNAPLDEKINYVLDIYRQFDIPEMIPRKEILDAVGDYELNPSNQLQELANFYGLNKNTSPYDPKAMYRRLAGEAEARLSEARMPLNAQERLNNFPFTYNDSRFTYDVKPEDMIIKGLFK
jgi:hypothetical protein